jgi:peptidoglycan/xylan/chitin deacetylase (PgdA/CDA1 family)
VKPALVLCYHSTNVSGNAYGDNDHVALRSDLATLAKRGVRVIPPEHVVLEPLADEPRVAITFDDGMILDAIDFEHPAHGPQASFLNILREHHQQTGVQVCAASFVIASPSARAELDRKDFLSLNVWHDDWWRDATASGYLTIENHSWDHNHPSLDHSVQRNNERGTFKAVDTEADADAEIAQACDYIEQRCGRRPRLLAYPWGEDNAFLADDYLPRRGAALGLIGAYVTGHGTDAGQDRWRIARQVCGVKWRSPAAFAALLNDHLRSDPDA